MSIPKIIHYCWFGGADLPERACRVLSSWRRHAPGFEIRRCDEDTFDVNSCSWTAAAYAAKKYAFVADYARFRMIYDYGGVYMDLGSELIKDITDLVESCSPFSAFEEFSRLVNPGLIFAAAPHDSLVGAVLSRYESMEFSDDPEFLVSNIVNRVFTSELKNRGLLLEDRLQNIGEWTILPSRTFSPVYGFGGFHITSDTYSVHHYSGSWSEQKEQVKQGLVRKLAPFIGRRAAQIVGRIVGEVKQEGLVKGIRISTGRAILKFSPRGSSRQ